MTNRFLYLSSFKWEYLPLPIFVIHGSAFLKYLKQSGALAVGSFYETLDLCKINIDQ